RHDEEWLRSHYSSRHGPVRLANHSEHQGALIVAGPRSRELLMRVSDADLSNAAFPYLAARSLRIAGTGVLALRASYVGELGWELHVAVADLPAVYDRLTEAGRALGLAHFGLYALDSLRLEKGYRSWKADLTSEYSPLAASLERFVRLDKMADFVGR